jgi:hypothetical protein
MNKDVLGQLSAELFGGRGIIATFEQQEEYRKLTDSWCELLIFSTVDGYVEKNPFSGDCNGEYIRLHQGLWWKAKKGNHTKGTPIKDLGVKLVYPGIEKFLPILQILEGDVRKSLLKDLEKGDIFCAQAMCAGLYDSGEIPDELYKNIWEVSDGLNGDQLEEIKNFF